MIPGHSALGGIEKALAELRQLENDASHRLEQTTRREAEAQADETEAFRDLAGFRLKQADSIGGRLGMAANEVRAILAIRLNDRNSLEAEVRQVEAEIQRLAAEREDFAARLTETEERRRALENEAQVALVARADYAGLKAETDKAVQVAEESEKKARLAEEELEEKRQPYEADPLFMYLWSRGYATSEYQAGNIARLLDGWVARLVRYQDSRPNFARLTEITKRLREHANRSAARAVELVEQAKAMEKAAFQSAGGAAADAEVAAQAKRLDELDKARARAEERHARLDERIAAFDRGEDTRFKQAAALLAEALRGEDARRLYQEALRTPSPDDEAIVQRITDARDRQMRFVDEAKRIRGELADIARRRGEISQVATSFRRRRYDADGSTFDNDVVGHLLRGLVTGVITGADYWSRMEQGRRWSRQSRDYGGGSTDSWGGANRGGGGTWGGGGSWGGAGSWGGGSGGSSGESSWGGGVSDSAGWGGSSGGGSSGGGDFETGGRF
ncbi:hypothetical protein [Phreatobacter sp.]|uniref:hypothetical protein n=1 Tax=Phreatobacter sp. TaxID=1966341 RepID=UPI003F71F95D